MDGYKTKATQPTGKLILLGRQGKLLVCFPVRYNSKKYVENNPFLLPEKNAYCRILILNFYSLDQKFQNNTLTDGLMRMKCV